MDATIFNIQRYSVHDGPGIRTTVFFKGCPLKCLWCHNPESQLKETELMFYKHRCSTCGRCLDCEARSLIASEPSVVIDREACVKCGRCSEKCPNDANKLSGYTMDTAKIFETVMKDNVFYKGVGGMTLSGGEPAMQSEAALELIRLANEAGINTVIETSGYGNTDFFLQAARLGVTFYFDIKCINPQKHMQLTGVSNILIHNNLRLLISSGARIVIRIPLIPTVNDSDSDLTELGLFLSSVAFGVDHAEIMKYHTLGSGKSHALDKEYKAPAENATKEDANRWLEKLSSYYKNIKISE